MSEVRRDNKGRRLFTGESQRKDGKYEYKYRDAKGKRKTVYSWKLTTADRVPKGKRDDLSLREKISQLQKDLHSRPQMDGCDLTVLELVEKYLAQKTGVRHNTKSNYKFVVNTVDIHGQNPVYLIPDKSNRFILIACLGTENLVAVERNNDGTLGNVVYNHYLSGASEGKNSCPHQIFYDREEKYLIVSAKGGRDTTTGAKTGINVFTFSPEAGFNLVYSLGGRNLDECRHVAVHPNNRFVYQVNERRNVVLSCTLNSSSGELVPFQTSQTLPDNCADPKLILASPRSEC